MNYSPVSIARNPRGTTFVRAAIAGALSAGSASAAAEIAHRRWPGDQLVQRAIAANTIGESGSWAEALEGADQVNTEFVELVSALTILGQLGDTIRKVPLRTRVVTAVEGLAASWIGEGDFKLFGVMSMAAETLAPKKVAALAAATKELLQTPGGKAERLIARDLSRAVAAAIDIAFINPANAGDDATPTSVTYNSPTVAYGASDFSNPTVLKNKIADLLDQFDGNLSTSFWIANPRVLSRLALLGALDPWSDGPQLAGVPIISNINIPDDGSSPSTDYLVLLDADAVVVGDDSEIRVRATDQASVELRDDATNNAITPTPTNLVSLWQCNSVGFLAERALNWKLGRANSVAVLTGLPRAS
jgi:hypothetical protein